MHSSKPLRQVVGALLACALCFSSAAAGAATAVAPPAIGPWVALSALSTPASATAVCAAGAAAVSAAQAPAAGCVLPVVDQPPPVAVGPAVTPGIMSPAVEGGGIGWLPLLGGLALIAAFAALVLGNDDDNDDSGVPISPA